MSVRVAEPPSRRTPKPPSPSTPSGGGWKKLLAPISSLRLTVILLALGIAVVFFGTLAQTEDGLYVAQTRYFRSWFSTWSPHDPAWKWIIVPLPGGYLLGVLLLVNLLAAHFVRFKFGWKKSGILMSHLGIIMLLVGQLATDMFARESRMSFAEGEWRNYSEDFMKTELAILTDTPDPTLEEVVAIPDSWLSSSKEIHHDRLPFTVRILEWAVNSERPRFRAPRAENKAPQASNGVALHFDFTPRAETHKMDEKNVPYALIEIVENKGKSLGTWIVSDWSGESSMAQTMGAIWLETFAGRDGGAEAMEQARPMANRLLGFLTEPQTFETGGRKYRIVLRPTRYYEPFSLKLLKATHEVYKGTSVPKNFQSRVLIDNARRNERREVDIYMNNPLRYAGLTFFQFQMGQDVLSADAVPTSALQVVKNPGWLTPYFGCGAVAAGLLVQFGIHLTGFIRKRSQTPVRP
jgi:ResB-like family